MKLTRVMSFSKYDTDELINKFVDGEITSMKFKKGSSWSGMNGNEGFVNETQYGVEIFVWWNEVDEKLVKKVTTEDIDEYDIMDIDIEKYDEYRNLEEVNLKIEDIADGREDVGYVEIYVK